ncbi:uncharacterized protein LOC101855949 [Aplysia californica]|uniref:Uncharacterized protein LOC101855949 n=1 Tax=Aplysia californica TaxID=6500 RepID=A0ABM0ZZZ8_APLCA|nr:uncharacterized protein LOC101855949 [Aplysia californica]
MEYFGFATGNSLFGPNFPSLPECLLKGYPIGLTEHPALPSVMDSSSVADPTPVAAGLLGAVLDRASVARNVGCGILAMFAVYGAWKVNLGWNHHLRLESVSDIDLDQEVQKNTSFSEMVPARETPHAQSEQTGPKEPTETPRNTSCGDSMEQLWPVGAGATVTHSSVQVFHRQLIEVLSRLEDTKCKLREVESARDLLNAEVTLHKNQMTSLQRELSVEKEKRLQAEMKMEMMEMENVQLKQVRKELSLRTDQVERLEKFLREKEEQQEKLFDENVVLPRAVAESRAKSFTEMQGRLELLESKFTASGLTGLRALGTCSQAPDNNTAPTLALQDGTSHKPDMKRRLSVSPARHPRSRCKLLTKEKTDLPHLSKGVSHTQEEGMPLLTPSTSPPRKMRKLSTMTEKNLEAFGNGLDVSQNTEDQTQEAPSSAGKEVKSQRSIIYKLKALIQGYNESSPESDIATQHSRHKSSSDQDTARPIFPVDTANNNLAQTDPSADPSSVFLSASCALSANAIIASPAKRLPDTTRAVTDSTASKEIYSPTQRPTRSEKRKLKAEKVKVKQQTTCAPVENSISDLPFSHPIKTGNGNKKTTFDFQVRYRPKKVEPEPLAAVHAAGKSEDSADDSEDSWIVIVPML